MITFFVLYVEQRGIINECPIIGNYTSMGTPNTFTMGPKLDYVDMEKNPMPTR